jgi:hypothetical protein
VRSSRSLAVFLVAAPAFALVCASNDAHAEPTSFLSVTSGYALEHDAVARVDNSAAALSFAVGVGTSPNSSFVVGGMFRTTTYFTLGTDIGIALRLASGGFARGEWGLALDAGAGFRTWGNGDSGKWPLQARIIGGAPWGLELSVGGDFWNLAGDGPYARGVNVVAGIDLLRLTIMRQGSTERFWENRHPVGGHSKIE